jgi:hypothetical protein
MTCQLVAQAQALLGHLNQSTKVVV